MLVQTGGLIVSLLLWQVPDILGQSKTDWILRNVSLIADKLNERDKLCRGTITELKEVSEIYDKLKELKQDTSSISGKLNERDKLWQDKFTELKQEVDSLPKKVSDIIRDSPSCQPLGSSCNRGMLHINDREKFLLAGKVLALCDTETDGGGWVVIQRRVRGDVDFYRGWEDYKRGFGTPDTDFWIGNDIIHKLTLQWQKGLEKCDITSESTLNEIRVSDIQICNCFYPWPKGYHELRIDFVYNGTNYFAQYTDFSVADESSNYRITISGFSGNVYDSMEYQNGSSFSTLDRDNDLRNVSCSVTFHGSWWYNDCFTSNLNGAWAKTDNTSIVWRFGTQDAQDDYKKPLTFTEMKIR